MSDLEMRRFDDAPIAEVLRLAREELGMEVAYVAEFSGGSQIYRVVEGTEQLDRLEVGESLPLTESYCDRMVSGSIPSVVPDAAHDPSVADLPVTREMGIGAYVGVPIVLSDGAIYGTMCCLSLRPQPELRDRDIGFMRGLTRLIASYIEQRRSELSQWQVKLGEVGVQALLAALAARDGYTGEHSAAVVDLAASVAGELHLSDDEIVTVRQTALLHDVGKIGIPDSVLRKPGSLDAFEWRLMREHPVIGARIVKDLPGLAYLAPVIEAEHEHWDGGGYPKGLSGEDIPVASRTVLVCDAYHAMRSNRPYRKAMSELDARAELRRNCGTQFWPDAVETLLTVLTEDPRPGRPDVAARPPVGVLLVDDDARARMLLRFNLEMDERFRVVGETGDGAEAIAYVKQERPDAVVLDLSMPVMDGLTAIPAIREASPHTKILVFSASDVGSVASEAASLGADGFVGKGVSLTEVNERLLTLFGDVGDQPQS